MLCSQHSLLGLGHAGDFTQLGGKLYVTGAEKIILNLLQQLGKTTKSFCMGFFTPESKPRPFGVQSQRLLTEGEVLEDEFLSTLNGGDDPAEKVSKAHKHQRILANSGRRRHAAKLLALRTHGILTNHTGKPGPQPHNQIPAGASLYPS